MPMVYEKGHKKVLGICIVLRVKYVDLVFIHVPSISSSSSISVTGSMKIGVPGPA